MKELNMHSGLSTGTFTDSFEKYLLSDAPPYGDFDICQLTSSQITHGCTSMVLNNMPHGTKSIHLSPTIPHSYNLQWNFINSFLQVCCCLTRSDLQHPLCVYCLLNRRDSFCIHFQLCMSTYRMCIPALNSSLKRLHFGCFIALSQAEVSHFILTHVTLLGL